MKATRWGLCALAVLTAGILGCPNTDMFTQKAAEQPPHLEDHLVDAKLEVTAEKAQAILAQMGIQATVSPDPEGFHLIGQTAVGKHVAVVLTRSPANETLTEVHLEWEAEEDNDLPRYLMAGLGRAGVRVLVSGG
jgi:hypothetical protein